MGHSLNPNYTKADLEQLLSARFIAPTTHIAHSHCPKGKHQTTHMCGFPPTQCSHQEGVAHSTVHSWGTQHGNRLWSLLIHWLFFRLPPSSDPPYRKTKNDLQHGEEGLRQGCHAIWFEERPTNLLAHSQLHLQGLLRQLSEVVLQELQRLQCYRHPPTGATTSLWQKSAI